MIKKTNYFTDPRDGKKYKTIRIGGQIWMAKNLAHKVKDGNYWAYDNYSINISKYGYLYDWETAQKAIPVGWRIPTKAEFETLIRETGGEKNAYNNLIKGGNSEFDAILGGFRNQRGESKDEGRIVDFWTSTEDKKQFAWHLGLFFDRKSVGIYHSLKNVGHYVRLIR